MNCRGVRWRRPHLPRSAGPLADPLSRKAGPNRPGGEGEKGCAFVGARRAVPLREERAKERTRGPRPYGAEGVCDCRTERGGGEGHTPPPSLILRLGDTPLFRGEFNECVTCLRVGKWSCRAGLLAEISWLFEACSRRPAICFRGRFGRFPLRWFEWRAMPVRRPALRTRKKVRARGPRPYGV